MVRAAQRQRAEAETQWKRAAALLHGLGASAKLEPDWAQLLREVEAELAPHAHTAGPR
jgi:hypothetical protein